MGRQLTKKVLLIGWDSADWNIINPLINQNKLPCLLRLVNNGTSGQLSTLEPVLSPMLWTSIATGKTADKHGILGFTEVNEAKTGIRPVNITSRKTKAIWNILSQNGYKSNIISWWPSYPAESINGMVVSEFFGVSNHNINEPWPVEDFSIHPKELSDKISKLRIHPQELTQAHLQPFIPNFQNLPDSETKNIDLFLHDLAHDATTQAIATWALEYTNWDFTAVYFNGMDSICHSYMKYMPPQQKGIPDSLFDLYKSVVEGIYIFYDMMLERMMELIPEDCITILVSDHGFHIDNKRVNNLPNEPLAPEHEHNPFGIIALHGKNVKKDEKIYGANLLDITPTILSIFGIPLGKDMDGKSLVQAFDSPPVINHLNSWDTIAGDDGIHAAQQQIKIADIQFLSHLEELGYIDFLNNPDNKKVSESIAINEFNLARVYMFKRQYEKAIPILKKLILNYERRYLLKLFECYENLNQVANMLDLIKLLKQEETNQIYLIDYLYGRYYSLVGNYIKAKEYFEKIINGKHTVGNVRLLIGKIYLAEKDYQSALRQFSSELKITQHNPLLFFNIALCYYNTHHYKEAIEFLLKAISIQYVYAEAHYFLGLSLFKLEHFSEAEKAFKICFLQDQNNSQALQFLKDIYINHLHNSIELSKVEQLIQEKTKEEIIVVSGLPRSGTSLIMQMLQQGGMDCFIDDIRESDENNPNGYYEHELVKRLPYESSWLNQAVNTCIKIISPLLFYLPDKFKYKVIYIERNFDEIALSQKRMLQRNGKKINIANYPLQLMEAFDQNKHKVNDWLNTQKNVSFIKIDYYQTIQNPEYTATNIINFIDKPLNKTKMVAAVLPELYREKISTIH